MLHCYGQSQIISPRLDQLAQEGMLFEQSYCQYPVCGPSRFSVLTGLRPNTSGIYGNYGNEPIWPETVQRITTMPQHFKKHGYHTISIGKIYHVPMVQDIEGWSEMPFALGTHNYLHPDNIQKQEMKRLEAEAKGLTDWEYRGALLVAATENANVADDEYYDGLHAIRAIEKMRELKDTPFFMALGFFRPHMPFTAPRKYWDLYSQEQIRLAENPFPPKNAPECALHNNFEPRAYDDVPNEGAFSESLQRRLIHGYYACVSYLDTLVGKVLDELERLRLRERTTIVFWGDNGFHLGDHDLWGKFTNFETSAHCPLIISDPDRKHSGARSTALTEYIDLYPTLCDLTGLPIPEHLEGISMMPLLDNPDQPWKQAAFSQFHNGDAWGSSVRTARYRLTEWVHGQTRELIATELYDHQNDPQENYNVAGDNQYRQIVEEVRSVLHQGWRAALPS